MVFQRKNKFLIFASKMVPIDASRRAEQEYAKIFRFWFENQGVRPEKRIFENFSFSGITHLNSIQNEKFWHIIAQLAQTRRLRYILGYILKI